MLRAIPTILKAKEGLLTQSMAHNLPFIMMAQILSTRLRKIQVILGALQLFQLEPEQLDRITTDGPLSPHTITAPIELFFSTLQLPGVRPHIMLRPSASLAEYSLWSAQVHCSQSLMMPRVL